MKQMKLFMQLKKMTTFQEKIKRNKLPFKNIVDNVTVCTKMVENFISFL